MIAVLEHQVPAGVAEAAETFTLRQGLVTRLLTASLVPASLQGPAKDFVAAADPGL